MKARRGSTVACALMMTGAFRRSVSGERRAPLCGMGICFECRATVDGVRHERTCELLCREGMDVRSNG